MPPWVIKATSGDIFIAPYFAKGLPDPHETSTFGDYHFHGHFNGRRVTALTWLAENHYRRADFVNEEEGDGDFREPQPVMIVDDWCFEPWPGSQRRGVSEVIKEIRRAGRLCPSGRSR
jgi:hypothetical protein